MERVFIIAEAGVNHNGDLKIAKKLVLAAKEAGADAVKFQTFRAEKLASKRAPKSEYQKQTTCQDESQFAMLKSLEIGEAEHKQLLDCCQENNILFLSSPFDLDSIEFLNQFGLKVFKIPSGEITNLPYLQKIGSLKKKIIMSSGMASLEEIGEALDVLMEAGTAKKDITVLHCNTEYPTTYVDVNLRAMLTIKKTYEVQIGYSDHTLGIEVPIAAVALGAKVIEKHFTLDQNMKGPDHKASLEPKELKTMITAIRNIEIALGTEIKEPSSSELKNRSVIRKSIIAAKKIKKGMQFSEDNLTIKRPGSGVSPMKWNQVIGKVAKRDFDEEELIEL